MLKKDILQFLQVYLIYIPILKKHLKLQRKFKSTLWRCMISYLNFQSGILIWKDNIFFGKGYRYYKNNCENFLKDGSNVGCSTHPHNIYIEILSDHGLIGLILFILFIFFILLENLRYFDQKKFYGFLITIIVISFL